MSKARRIKKIKQERQKMSLIDRAIQNLKNPDYEPDFFIVTVPGAGSVNITSNLKDIRRYCE